MGNWRTVRIVGTCAPAEVGPLREALDWEVMSRRPVDDWACHALLCSGGLCGLGDWPAARIDRVGNLFERNYSVEDAAAALRECVRVAPSLTVKVHCGGEYEDPTCIATVRCEGGEVSVWPAEVASVGEIPEEQMRDNLVRALLRRPGLEGSTDEP